MFRQQRQVDVLLEALEQAADSSGSRKPVIADGRDGITLREYAHSAFKVATYYHASERIWTMAEVLFGKGTRAANAWAHRMLKSLKKPSGVSRVLHSAASHFHRRQRTSRKLSRKKEEIYWTAYRYIQSRASFMRYSEYRSVHLPLGRGVTEAACKTVFTQRLKNSGMRWSHDGAKTILTLRTILLSKSWSSTYAAFLDNANSGELRPYRENQHNATKTAA